MCFLTEGQWRQVDDACFPGSSGKFFTVLTGKFLHPVLKGSKSLPLEQANLIFCSDIVFSPIGCWWSTLATRGLQDGLPQGILEIVWGTV